MKYEKPKRTSIRRVGHMGKPAPSWTPDKEFTELANRCYIACINEYAKPDLIRVYRNGGGMLGRCWVGVRIITVNRRQSRDSALMTLAHEIAHLRVSSHCPKHEALTDRLYEWIKREVGEEEAK